MSVKEREESRNRPAVERQEVRRAPGKVVAAVALHCLQNPQRHPQPQREQVRPRQSRAHYRCKPKKQNFSWMCILRCQPEWGGISVKIYFIVNLLFHSPFNITMYVFGMLMTRWKQFQTILYWNDLVGDVIFGEICQNGKEKYENTDSWCTLWTCL